MADILAAPLVADDELVERVAGVILSSIQDGCDINRREARTAARAALALPEIAALKAERVNSDDYARNARAITTATTTVVAVPTVTLPAPNELIEAGEIETREIAALKAERDQLREALAWYGEQARLCRLIHSGGDAGRHALSADGGTRARAIIGPAQ